jgi:AraC-like DNA-binding protein
MGIHYQFAERGCLTKSDKRTRLGQPRASRRAYRACDANDGSGEGGVRRIPTVERDPGAPALVDVVHARILRFFPELVREHGGDPAALMRRAGIGFGNLPEGSDAGYRQVVHLLELAAIELECPDFGLRLAALQNGGRMFGPLGMVMQNSRTFGDALDYVGSHAHAHSLAARIWLERSRTERTVFVGHDIVLDRLPNKTQAIEQILLLGHLAAMEMTGGLTRVRRVDFRHQPVSPLKTYRRYFGCDVRFGQNRDGVVFSERDLARPIIEPDARVYQATISFIDTEFRRQRPPLHAQVRGVVMRFLGTEHCTNERVAAELNLHPRTLHRRLAEEGTSYQQVKDAVRCDALLYYVRETDLDFSFISEKLGFAEQSVMARYCNHRFSASPTKLRAQPRQTEPEL